MSIVLGNLSRVEITQHSHQATTIPVIGYTTTIVAFSGHIEKRIIWYLIIFVEEHLQLSYRDTQIGFVESIWNIKTEWTEFTTLLNKRVKEAQTE